VYKEEEKVQDEFQNRSEYSTYHILGLCVYLQDKLIKFVL